MLIIIAACGSAVSNMASSATSEADFRATLVAWYYSRVARGLPPTRVTRDPPPCNATVGMQHKFRDKELLDFALASKSGEVEADAFFVAALPCDANPAAFFGDDIDEWLCKGDHWEVPAVELEEQSSFRSLKVGTGIQRRVHITLCALCHFSSCYRKDAGAAAAPAAAMTPTAPAHRKDGGRVDADGRCGGGGCGAGGGGGGGGTEPLGGKPSPKRLDGIPSAERKREFVIIGESTMKDEGSAKGKVEQADKDCAVACALYKCVVLDGGEATLVRRTAAELSACTAYSPVGDVVGAVVFRLNGSYANVGKELIASISSGRFPFVRRMLWLKRVFVWVDANVDMLAMSVVTSRSSGELLVVVVVGVVGGVVVRACLLAFLACTSYLTYAIWRGRSSSC